MKSFFATVLLALVASASSEPCIAVAAAPGPAKDLSCTIGPLSKTFGKTQWVVYGCNDGRSLVVTTARGNPAVPFYFLVYWGPKGMSLYGEGTGDKKITDAAYEELRTLTEADVAALYRDAKAVAAGSGSSKVQTRFISKGRYELTETVSGTTDLADAQRMLIPESKRLCGSLSPQFGRYKFNSIEPVLNAGDAGSTSITLEQEVECGEETSEPNAAVTVDSQAPLKAPSSTDEAIVRARTLDYLAAKDRGEFDTALAMFTSTMQAMMTQDSWRTPRAAFNSAAGIPSQREVVRVTWYDNPPGVAPGRYVAADYRARFKSAAFYCGYLSWLQQPDGSYRIVREEEGQMTPKEANKVAPGQMAAMRLQLGCRD
jgi:hypothetical protein